MLKLNAHSMMIKPEIQGAVACWRAIESVFSYDRTPGNSQGVPS